MANDGQALEQIEGTRESGIVNDWDIGFLTAGGRIEIQVCAFPALTNQFSFVKARATGAIGRGRRRIA